MLSVGKVSTGQEGYYLAAVARGAEEYYSERGDVPGRWIGAGADELGLAGDVDDDEFRTVLSGSDPSTGARLRRGNARVCAFDLTLSAPKSVSVLWALGDAEIAAAVVAAHEDAVDAAVGYVEREALRSRRGHDGLKQVDGGGLIGAAFRHRTSRAGDPQLHTHVVVANATHCVDGVWRTLDGRHLYSHARTAGFLYQAELRHALTRTLGVEWEPVAKGVGEIAGIPDAVLREFSRRRIQIEAAMRAEGDVSIGSARRLAVQTRPAKQLDVNPATLALDWHHRAGLHGLDRTALQRRLRSQRASVPTPVRGAVHVTDETLARVLTAHDPTFDRRAVLRVLAEHAGSGATVGDLEAHADRFLAGRHVEAVGLALTGVQYSTIELLEIEHHLLDHAAARRDESVGVCDPSALVRDASLSTEQRAMVSRLTSDGAGVSVVVGAAGTGKTHALAVARQAWQQNGYTVIGCALSARAANELQTSAEIPSYTLDSLLAALERNPHRRLKPRTVVVVDEAAMVGTRQLARLCDHAAQAHAKVVLVGDHHQLPAIEAGGAFAALAQRLGAVHLTTNQRQRDPIERDALTELRTGDVDRAIEQLDARGHLHRHTRRETAYAAMVADWLPAALKRQDVIMLAPRRVDVAELNQRARHALISHGRVDPYRLGTPLAMGDRIITLTNDRRLGLINGERGLVTAVDPRTGNIEVLFDRRRDTTTVSAAYIDAGGLDYAYAMTVHKAQGLTCDRAYVLGDEHLHREAGYTALSRGRHENHLYTIGAERDDESHVPIDPDVVHDAIRRALVQSMGKELASEWQRHSREPPDLGHDVGIEP